MESKVVIVTGASRGIGLAVAQTLLAASHKVVLVSRSAEQLQELKDRYPSQVAYLAADMTVADVSHAEKLPAVVLLEARPGKPRTHMRHIDFSQDSVESEGTRHPHVRQDRRGCGQPWRPISHDSSRERLG